MFLGVCARGSDEACTEAIRLTEHDADALAVAEVGCKAGAGWTCVVLGQHHVRQGNRQDAPKRVREGVTYYDKACQAGSGEGCARYGDALVDGMGLRRDVEGGLKYLRSTCSEQMPEPCEALGDRYMRPGDSGLTASVEVAQGWYENGCAGGHIDACTSLAKTLVETGDTLRANALLGEICDAGGHAGCYELGQNLWFGRAGLAVDRAAGEARFEQGCAAGKANGLSGTMTLLSGCGWVDSWNALHPDEPYPASE